MSMLPSTLVRSASVSWTLRRCSRSVWLSVFTSQITSPTASPRRARVPRRLKSPSRSASSRFDSVYSGNTTRLRSRAASTSVSSTSGTSTVSQSVVRDS
jgi:hypothetical protein